MEGNFAPMTLTAEEIDIYIKHLEEAQEEAYQEWLLSNGDPTAGMSKTECIEPSHRLYRKRN